MMAKKEEFWNFFEIVLEDLKKRRPAVDWKIVKHHPTCNWVAFYRIKHNTWYGIGFTSEARLRVDLHISLDNEGNTEALFDKLHDRKGVIEKALGLEVGSLKWESPANLGAQAGRIAVYKEDIGIDDSPERLLEARKWAVDMIISLRTALTSHLEELSA